VSPQALSNRRAPALPRTTSGVWGAAPSQVEPSEDESCANRSSRRVPRRDAQTLLIADDDPEVLRSLERSLGRRYHLLLAMGGAEAVAIIKGAETIHFVLCDLMMPEQDGASVYEAVLQLRPALAKRFVLMTGGTHTTRGRSFLDRFPGSVLFKPFAPDQVIDLVEAAGPL
jgi:DNA-binding NtrC family response regulator